LDECRFTYNGIPVSKEIARIYYRKTEWFENLEQAKKKDKIEWKKYVNLTPPKLPEKLCVLISNIYRSYANEITQRKFFCVPSLKEVLREIKSFI
ncbi:MAG: phosphoribosylaminoimidazolesuccinocarboxamide synthase, partial [Candidatus Omnitrophica bacterium]|nr:phosphoribosylaminoimidazolesuccinocarboxamide synthase [Candidatus Omnitrophota bacterium]